MKKLSKIVSIVLSLALCLGMASPAFAASFTDLQNAIDGKEGTGTAIKNEDGTDSGRYGYSWNEKTEEKDGYWGIEAWDEDGTRNVQLNEEVKRSETEEKGISISGSETDVTIDLNGQTINGNNQSGSVIAVKDGGKLTVEDSSGKDESGKYVSAGDGKITGGTGEALFKNPDGSGKAGGGVYVEDSKFTLNGGNITGNKSYLGGGIAMVNGADVTITNGSVSDNTSVNHGGGIYHYGNAYPGSSKASLTVSGGTISNNKAETQDGGAIFSLSMFGTNEIDVKISGATIENNSAGGEGGAIYLSGQKNPKPSLEITDSSIRNNSATYGGALSLNCDGLTIKDSTFENNTETKTNKNTFCEGLYFFSTGERDISGLISQNSDGSVTIANGEEKVTITAPEGEKVIVDPEKGTIQIPAGGAWGDVVYEYGAIIDKTGTVIEVLTNPEPEVPETPEVPEVPVTPDDSGADAGEFIPADTAPAAATIADQEVPLAGLVSREILISYLYVQAGSPDGEDAEGEYTKALAWAVANGIIDAESDPEEVVTVAVLRDVMARYAKLLDVAFDVEIPGEDDEIVMNCNEILEKFFAAQEDKAA